MPEPIEFYFDFSSPYGYLAAQQVDDLGARQGRDVLWRPFLLGALFKTTGQQPLLDVPLKGDYAKRDMDRAARRLGVPFRLPERFPFSAVAASRAVYWLDAQDPGAARALAKALYHAVFGAGRDLGDREAVVAVAAAQGHDAEAVRAGLNDSEVKARLRREVETAERKGVFGSPFLIVDGEPFWGHDRLADAERWAETGGW
jgi:2-hydroxychromene-2-carboxylate isomerase